MQPSLETVLRKLDALESIARASSIPVADRYLDAADIAALLSLKPAYVREKICSRPDFPAAMRVDGKGHPRWKGSDVLSWAETHR